MRQKKKTNPPRRKRPPPHCGWTHRIFKRGEKGGRGKKRHFSARRRNEGKKSLMRRGEKLLRSLCKKTNLFLLLVLLHPRTDVSAGTGVRRKFGEERRGRIACQTCTHCQSAQSYQLVTIMAKKWGKEELSISYVCGGRQTSWQRRICNSPKPLWSRQA